MGHPPGLALSQAIRNFFGDLLPFFRDRRKPLFLWAPQISLYGDSASFISLQRKGCLDSNRWSACSGVHHPNWVETQVTCLRKGEMHTSGSPKSRIVDQRGRSGCTRSRSIVVWLHYATFECPVSGFECAVSWRMSSFHKVRSSIWTPRGLCVVCHAPITGW